MAYQPLWVIKYLILFKWFWSELFVDKIVKQPTAHLFAYSKIVSITDI